MSGRNWGYIIAAFGCMALGSQSLGAQGITAQSAAPTGQTADSERAEDESKSHVAKELDAQIRAAVAAERQVFLSLFGSILSFGGTLLIVWTLCLTRKQLRMAREDGADARDEAAKLALITASALSQATISAGAATDAVKAAIHANDIAMRAGRPWLTLDKQSVSALAHPSAPDTMQFRLDFLNTGSRPAMLLLVASTAAFRPIEDAVEVPIPNLADSLGFVGPGRPFSGGVFDYTNEQLQAFGAGKGKIKAIQYVRYFDPMFPNDIFETEVRADIYFIAMSMDGNGVIFSRMTPTGTRNRMT